MFCIELNPAKAKKQREAEYFTQRQKLSELTDFECHIFGVYAASIGFPEMQDFVASFVKQRSVNEEDVYVGDKDVMATCGTLNHGTGGGKRNIRGTNSLT